VRGAGSTAAITKDIDGPLLCKCIEENRDDCTDGVVWQMVEKLGKMFLRIGPPAGEIPILDLDVREP
jgi:hypothetical protein